MSNTSEDSDIILGEVRENRVKISAALKKLPQLTVEHRKRTGSGKCTLSTSSTNCKPQKTAEEVPKSVKECEVVLQRHAVIEEEVLRRKKAKKPVVAKVKPIVRQPPKPDFERWLEEEAKKRNPRWVRKPKIVRQNRAELSENSKKFLDFFNRTDRLIDEKFKNDVSSLSPIEKQTGISTHVPSSGLPFPAPKVDDAVSEIRRQMDGVMAALKDKNLDMGKASSAGGKAKKTGEKYQIPKLTKSEKKICLSQYLAKKKAIADSMEDGEVPDSDDEISIVDLKRVKKANARRAKRAISEKKRRHRRLSPSSSRSSSMLGVEILLEVESLKSSPATSRESGDVASTENRFETNAPSHFADGVSSADVTMDDVLELMPDQDEMADFSSHDEVPPENSKTTRKSVENTDNTEVAGARNRLPDPPVPPPELPPPQRQISSPVVSPPVSAREPARSPININPLVKKLLDKQLCIRALEIGECDLSNCKVKRHFSLTLEEVLLYYQVKKSVPANELLPSIREKMADGGDSPNKVGQLVALFKTHMRPLRDSFSTSGPILQFLNTVLDDMMAGWTSEDRDYIFVAKTLFADLTRLYRPDDFAMNYLVRITQDELVNFLAALDKFAEVARRNVSANRDLSEKLAWSVFETSLKCGLVMNPVSLKSIWATLLQAESVQYTVYVANFVTQLSLVDFNENLFRETVSLYEDDDSYLGVLVSSFLALDRDQIATLGTPLLQRIFNTMSSCQRTECDSILARMKSLQFPNIFGLAEYELRFLNDTMDECRISRLLDKNNWAGLAAMLLEVPLKKVSKAYEFMLNFFRVVIETEDAAVIDSAFTNFATAFRRRNGDRLLPVQIYLFSQLAATFVVHFEDEPERSLPTLSTCIKMGIQPQVGSTLYDPEGAIVSLQTKRSYLDIVLATLSAYMRKVEYHQKAFELFIIRQVDLREKLGIGKFYELSRDMMVKLLDVQCLNDQGKHEKVFNMTRFFDHIMLPMTVTPNCAEFSDERRNTILDRLFNQLLMTVLEIVNGLAQKTDILETHMVPFVNRHRQLAILSEGSVRGLVSLLQQIESVFAVDFYKNFGLVNGVYPAQDLGQTGAKVVLLSDWSPYEMAVVINEAFKDIANAITEGDICRIKENLDSADKDADLIHQSGIHRISFSVKIDQPDCSLAVRKTCLTFIDHFNVTSISQAVARASQVFSSLSPPVAVMPRSNIKTNSILDIEPVSLIRHLYTEVLGK